MSKKPKFEIAPQDAKLAKAECNNNFFEICNMWYADFTNIDFATNSFNYVNFHGAIGEENLRKAKVVTMSKNTDADRKKAEHGRRFANYS